MNTLSKFMVEPRIVHWTVAKHMLRYLAGTTDYGLDYRRFGGVGLVGYIDLDWAGSVSDQKSTFSCCFNFGFGSCVMVQQEAKVHGIEFC